MVRCTHLVRTGPGVPHEVKEFSVAAHRTAVYLLAENCLLREALVRLLRRREDVVTSGAMPFSPGAFDAILSAKPHVVLFDSSAIALSGPRLVSRLLQSEHAPKAVMVGMEEDEATFLRAVGEGVMGYILRDASASEIVRVIRAVAAGEAVCPPRFSTLLFQCAARDLAFSYNPSHRAKFGLSRREQQVIGIIRLGMSNKEIGSRLNLSEQTVKNYVHRILRKVGAADRLDILDRCRADTIAVDFPALAESVCQ
ncbi:MAG: response regulator transcription factor [Terriglobales bacterium]